jgi:hypothetical protein
VRTIFDSDAEQRHDTPAFPGDQEPASPVLARIQLTRAAALNDLHN